MELNEGNNYSRKINVTIKTKYLGIAKITVTFNSVRYDEFSLTVLATEYNLHHGEFLAIALKIVYGFMNFLMGTQLSITTVISIVKQPVGPLIGFGCQFLMMPLMAYFLIIQFLPSKDLADKLIRLSFFACSCCPGGGKSTFWTIIFDGNLNMSIAMTISQTLGALVMMPLWLILTLGTTFFDENLKITWWKLVFPLGLLIVPALLGMIFIYFFNAWMTKIKTLLKILSWIFTIAIMVSILVVYRETFHYFSWKIFLVCCVHPYLGYILSYSIAWMFRRDHMDRVTIAIETGTQNVGIAVISLMDTFLDGQDPKFFITLTVPVTLLLTIDKPLWIIWMIKAIGKKCFKKKFNNEVNRFQSYALLLNREMSDKDAKLLQAKQLLKKYQTKKDETSNGTRPNSTGVNGDLHSEVGSLSSSRASSTVICDQTPQILNQYIVDQQEMEFLKKTIDEKEKSLKDVVGKLQNLQTHYAELHSAYMTAVQVNSNGAPPEYTDQLAKLQTALGVAIEEKTSFQSQLRTATAKLQALEADNKDMHAMLKATTGSSTLHETEKRKLREEMDELALKLKKTLEELEKHRTENLAIESKLRGVSQDRTDLQARLKYIFNEKDELEKQLAEARHNLEMKEIFIKQLTYSNPAQGETVQQAITTLTEEKEKLLSELSKVNESLTESERQQKATKDYYESCVAELNSRISDFEGKLKSISIEKADLEATKNSLEDKVNYLLTQQAANLVPQSAPEQPHVIVQQQPPQFDPVEIQALKNSLAAVQGDYSRAVDRIRELEILVQEKESGIEQLEKSLTVEQARTENLRSEVENQKTVNNDVHSLLEQLQNEKATVSRAIAQNIELKEQLGELQDRFIEITNESALREEQKQSAFATIDRLQQQLDQLINERNNPLKIERADEGIQTDMDGLKMEVILKNNVEQQTDFTFGQTIISHANENMKNGTTENEEIIAISEASTERIMDSRHDGYSHSPVSSAISTSSNSSISRDEIIRQLESKLETLANEKKEIQIANDKLQYFLTALESENESIGEYIALYRFQRQTIQKRVAEKDALISQLDYEKKAAQAQIGDLQQVLYNLFGQSPPVLTGNINEKQPESNGEESNLIVDKLNQILLEIRHKQHRSSVNTSSNEFVDPKLHCPECRGQMFTL